jgi:hypothetical protein
MAEARRLSAEMYASALQRFRESDLGKDIGNAYDSDFAKGLAGAMNDIYRRVFEQGWFGRDTFDGRFHMDNNSGRESGIESMDKQYDTRAEFYGWDQTQENGSELNEMGREHLDQHREAARERELER